MIRLLKAGVVEQAREIRENRKELLFTEASLDAVSGLFIILLKMQFFAHSEISLRTSFTAVAHLRVRNMTTEIIPKHAGVIISHFLCAISLIRLLWDSPPFHSGFTILSKQTGLVL